MSSADHQPTPRRVLIAGGGVAGLDAVLAVRALAPELEVRLLTPKRRSTYRPMAFGGPGAVHVDLPALAAERGFTLTRDALDTVRPGERVVITQDRERLAYDELVLAVGARRRAGVRGALPFRGPRDVARVEAALERLEEQNRCARVAFVGPSGASCPLALFELALLTEAWARFRRLELRMELVSAEAAPPSAELAARLAEHGVEVRLSWDGAEVPQADLVVALTVLEGPSVSGIPCDDRGFLPVDEAGRVTGLDHVWAIGDAAARHAGPRVPVADQADALARALSAVSLAA